MNGELQGKTLRFERLLAHRPAKVWHVLTDEAETAGWFPARIVGPRVAGGEVRFVFGEKPPGVLADDLAALIRERQAGLAGAPDAVFRGRIEAFEPPRLFALRWGADTLRFELTPDGAGTRLRFTCDFDTADATDVGPGWHVSLDWLADRLDAAPKATTRSRLDALEAEYRRAFARDP